MKDSLVESSNPSFTQLNTFVAPTNQEEVSLGKTVVSSLRKYWYVAILTSAIVMSAIVYKTLREPRVYQSGMQISIDLKKSASDAENLAARTGGNNNISDNTGSERVSTIATTIFLMKSRSLIKQAIEQIPEPQLRPSVNAVASGLVITPRQGTDILDISYSDFSPPKTVAVLNALSKVYINYSIKAKKARTDNSIAFIESQLPESRKRLDRQAQLIEDFRRKYQFIDPASSASSLASYQQSVTTRLNDAQVAFLQTKQEQQELNRQLAAVGLKSDSNLTTTMLTQDSAYQKLFSQLSDMDLKLSQEQVRLSDNNPLVLDLREKRAQVLGLLKQRAQQVLNRQVSDAELTNGAIANFGNSLAQNLANKQAQIETSLASQLAQQRGLYALKQQLDTQIAQLPTLQKQFTELDRQYTIYSQELTAFLQRLQGLQLVNSQEVVPWNLLDPPELPLIPISPDIPRQLGIGAVASLAAGILVAVGLKKLDNRIDNPDTIKNMTGMPLLALIPKVEDFQRQAAMRGGAFLQVNRSRNQDYSYWSFVEAIRTLSFGIGFAMDKGDSNDGKIVAMTSASPKEGKSTVAFNTSITLAELGYSVLLIDGDLYRNSISKFVDGSAIFAGVDCSNTAGLTDAISGVDSWQNLVKKAPQLKLDVLLGGSQSVNSVALLNSPRLTRLLAEWRKDYDYVIFDTPPLVGVSDSQLITTLVDGIIFVVGLNVARRQSITRAMDIIFSTQTPVLGLAINQVDNQPGGYDKYQQYYQESAAEDRPTKILNQGSPGVRP